MTGSNMNDEFQLRSALRTLDVSVQPERDLWPQIGQRLQTPQRRRRLAGLAVAASLAILCMVSLLALRVRPHVSNAAVVSTKVVANTRVTATTPDSRTALSWAVPNDPALAAAAHNLDDASAQLQHALEQHPDAVFLVGLLNRTNSQRMRLLREPFTG